MHNLLTTKTLFAIIVPISIMFMALILAHPNQAWAKETTRDCFRVFDITSFEYLDPEHTLLKGRTNSRNYLVSFRRSCRDLKFSSKLSTSFENSLVCPPFNEYIKSVSDSCPVKTIEKVKSKQAAQEIIAKRAAAEQIKEDQ